MSTNLSAPSNALVKMREHEPYVSDGLNKKLHGVVPAGVVRGGVLSTNVAVDSVTILADTVTGDSVYSYADANGAQYTFRQVGDVTLSLAGVPGTPLVVYVALYVEYVLGTPTLVYWRAYTEAELFGGAPVAEAAYVVVLGEVDLPAIPPGGVIPAANITPNRRRSAWANTGSDVRDWRNVTPEGGFQSCAISAYSATENQWGGWLTDFLSSFVATVPDVQAAQAHSGDRSLRVVLAGGAFPQQMLLAHGAQFECHEGQMLDASVWVMGTAIVPAIAVGGHLGLMFEFFDEVGAVVATEYVEDITLAGGFAWTEVSRILAVPATTSSARVYVVMDDNSSGTAGSFFFDDVRVFVSAGHAKSDYGQDDPVKATVRANSIDIAPIPTTFGISTLIDSTLRLSQVLPVGLVLQAVMRARGALATHPFSLLLDAGALTIDRVIEGLGEDMIGSLANAAIARITATLPAPATSPYVLLAHLPQADVTKFPIRMYASGLSTLPTAGEMVFVTINALWRNATNDWTRDLAGDSVLFGLSRDGIYLRWYPAAGAAVWIHAGWTSIAGPTGEPIMSIVRQVAGGTLANLNDAIISIVNATAISNPAIATPPVKDSLYAKNIVKAWGKMTSTGGGLVTLDDGFNIQNPPAINGNNVRVTFHVPFTTAHYGVVATPILAGVAADETVRALGQAAATCDFAYYVGGAQTALGGTAKTFSVMFMGVQ